MDTEAPFRTVERQRELFEYVRLEKYFNEDEIKCESSHQDGDPCSIEVTHIGTCACNGSIYRVCANRAAKFEKDKYSRSCAYCYRVLNECWTIRPI